MAIQSTTKSEMVKELAAWCAAQGLPTHLTASKLLASPDSLAPTQREWLRSFRNDYDDAPEGT